MTNLDAGMMTKVFWRVLLWMSVLVPWTVMADDALVDYMPQVGGAVRARCEYDMHDHTGRFQVRNARVQVSGHTAPAVSYCLKVDVCDRGSVKLLDAYGRFQVSPWLNVSAGRQSIPFSVDASRSPGTYYFSKHSFVEHLVGPIRGPGFQVMTVAKGKPVYFDAGVFKLYDATGDSWSRSLDYVARAGFRWGNVKFEAGVESTVPDSIRINMLDASLCWSYGRWLLEFEYLNKHYTHDRYPVAYAVNLLADYTVPLRHRSFRKLSFQARFDSMSDHSNGCGNGAGVLVTDDPKCRRMTFGSTLFNVSSRFRTEFRVNYEVFVNGNDSWPKYGYNNKLIAEIVLLY